MNSLRNLLSFVMVAAVAVYASAAVAGTIVWQSTAPVFLGANDALNPTYNGLTGLTVAQATTWAATGTVTTSGTNASVAFGGDGSAFSTNAAINSGYGTGFVSSPSNAAFDGVLQGGTIDSPGGVITANNLVKNQPYAIQIFSVDDRGCCSGRTNSFTAGNTSPFVVQGNNQYVIGAVTADAATQAISVNSGLFGSNPGYTVNAAVAYTPNITWNAPQPITTADATLGGLPGTIVSATGWGNGGNVAVTLTGGQVINFQAGTLNSNNALSPTAADATGYADQSNAGFFTAGGNTTSNANFDTVLNAAAYDGSNNLITLTGLTPGQQYTLQLFAPDTRGCCSGRQLSFTGVGNSLSSPVITEGDATYLLGTFTALGTTQVLRENFVNLGAGNINALVLRAVPEPASAALLALGAFAFMVRRQRSR